MSHLDDDEDLRQAMQQFEEMERAEAEREAAALRKKTSLQQQQEQDRIEEEELATAIRLSEEDDRKRKAAAVSVPASAAAAAVASKPLAGSSAAAASSASVAASSTAAVPAASRRSSLPPTGITVSAVAAPPLPSRKSMPSSLERLGSGRISPIAAAASPAASVSPKHALPSAQPARKRKSSEGASSSASASPSHASASPRFHSSSVNCIAEYPSVPSEDAVDFSPLHTLRTLFPGRSPFAPPFVKHVFRTHSRGQTQTVSKDAYSESSNAAASSSAAAAAPSTGGVGADGLPFRNYTATCDADLVAFVEELRLLLFQSPQSVLPPEVVRALWSAVMSEDVSAQIVERMSSDFTHLLTLSPHSFIPDQQQWKSWCNEALDFCTWLQAKEKAQRDGELEKIKQEVLSSKHCYPNQHAAASADSDHSAAPGDLYDILRLDAELDRQRSIAATLSYQEKQESHYVKWLSIMRLWTSAFIIDIFARQRGVQFVAQQIMNSGAESFLEELLAQLPSKQSDPHWPPPLLYSLVTRAEHILQFSVSDADAAALAKQQGPKLKTEEEQLNDAHSVLAPMLKKGTSLRGGSNRGRGARGRAMGGRGGASSKASTSASASDSTGVPAHASKRGRSARSSISPRLSRPTRSDDDEDSLADAPMHDDADAADGDPESSPAFVVDDWSSDDPHAHMNSFVVWWRSLLRWIGLDSGSSEASRADPKQQRKTASTFRSREALVAFQTHVARFLQLSEYVLAAQIQRTQNEFNREEAQQRGRRHHEQEIGLLEF